MKGYRKHKKRGDIQRLKKRVYHLQHKDDVVMAGIKKKLLVLRNKIEIAFHPCILLDVT